MENNNNPGYRRRQRGAAGLPVRVADLERLLKVLIEATRGRDLRPNTPRAQALRIYKRLNTVEMAGQAIHPSLGSDVIGVAFKGVKCGLLMYVLLGDMPWPIFVLCVVMALAFVAFIAN